MTRKVYYGAVANPVDPAHLDLLTNTVLAIEHGKVAWIEHDVRGCESVPNVLVKHSWPGETVTNLGSGEWLMPGFVDTHTVSFLFR
jgi:cytosine/adenosine deaminase-related metal-dependent hydrolase